MPHIKPSEPFHSTRITGIPLASRIDETLRASHSHSFPTTSLLGPAPDYTPSSLPPSFDSRNDPHGRNGHGSHLRLQPFSLRLLMRGQIHRYGWLNSITIYIRLIHSMYMVVIGLLFFSLSPCFRRSTFLGIMLNSPLLGISLSPTPI